MPSQAARCWLLPKNTDGAAWDSWHYENSAYIPNWYAVAGLLVDLTRGAYLAARIPVYREEARIAKKN